MDLRNSKELRPGFYGPVTFSRQTACTVSTSWDPFGATLGAVLFTGGESNVYEPVQPPARTAQPRGRAGYGRVRPYPRLDRCRGYRSPDHSWQPGQERLLQHLGRSGPVGLIATEERVPNAGPFLFAQVE